MRHYSLEHPEEPSWVPRDTENIQSASHLEPDDELGRNGVKALDQMVGFQPFLRSGGRTDVGRSLPISRAVAV